jgi:hypothetical protein
VRPSSDCDEYDSAISGSGPFRPGGTRSGYDQVKSPAWLPAAQEDDGWSDVAA